MMIINNVGSSCVYAIVYSSGLVIYQITKLIKSSKLEKFREKVGKHLEWNLTITLALDQLPLLILTALINLMELKFNSMIKMVSSLLTICVFLITPVFIFSIIKMLRNYELLSEQEAKKGSAIVNNINIKQKNAKYWHIAQFIRWNIVIIILVVFRVNYIVQIFSLIFMSLLT